MSQIQNTNSGAVLWRVATGVILLALLPIPVRADDYRDAFPPPEVREYFYTDDSGFVYRGGIAMRDPFGLHARNLNLTDLRLEGPRDLCSMSGLWADYQALFSREFIEDTFDLERQVVDLARYKKLEEELVAHPMLELLREVATEEESISTQVKPGGAAERSTQSGQRLQDNLGSFSDVVGPNSESGF